MTPAVAYYRMSTDKQEASIPAQREEVERYANENGYKILREYIDEAISGDETEKRLEFQRMIADAATGEFKVVLCWDQDRFGRFDSVEAGQWIQPLRKAGVSLATVAQGVIDWNDFVGRLMFTINQEGKHQYLRDLSRNTARGQAKNAEKGYLCGQAAPYGYDRMFVDENGTPKQRVRNGEKFAKDRSWHAKLVPSEDPEKITTAKWLFDTFANTDVSLRGLADQLNERGIPGPKGGPWYSATIKAILENNAYAGTFTWGKRREGKYHCVVGGEVKERTDGKPVFDNPREAWTVKEDAHEALVDKATFQKVQEKLNRRRRADNPSFRSHRKQNGDAYLLTGLVHCDHCGCKMHGTMCSRKKNGKLYQYPKYICSTYNRCGKNNPSGCGCHGAHQSVVVNVLLKKLRTALLRGESKDRLLGEVKQQLAARSRPDETQLKRLRDRITDLDRQIQTAANRLMCAPEDLMDVLAPQLMTMKRERERLGAERTKLESMSAPVDVEVEAARIVDEIWHLSEELLNAEPARLRELLQSYVERIELRFDKVPRGKRVECPLVGGKIHLRARPHMYSSVNRGDCRIFEPSRDVVHQYVRAFLETPAMYLQDAIQLAQRSA